MSQEDKKLAALYWRLQKQSHVNPKLRTYVHRLWSILQARHIDPCALNNVGVELASEGAF